MLVIIQSEQPLEEDAAFGQTKFFDKDYLHKFMYMRYLISRKLDCTFNLLKSFEQLSQRHLFFKVLVLHCTIIFIGELVSFY